MTPLPTLIGRLPVWLPMMKAAEQPVRPYGRFLARFGNRQALRGCHSAGCVEKAMTKKPQTQQNISLDAPHSDAVTTEVIFLRLPDVKAITGLSKTSLYELVGNQRFPPPVRLGPRAVAWVRSEVMEWAMNRIQASRTPVFSRKGPMRALPAHAATTDATRKSA